MEEELQKVRGQQIPIKTKTGGRHLDYISEVRPGVLILCTNADGTGRKTILALNAIESFTCGGGDGGDGTAAANWKPSQ